jgi:ATP-dependent Clp protease ATP-binding subunit ClpA
MKVSAEVKIACSVAATEASRRGHEVMTVEHLLYALLLDLPTAKVLRLAGGNIDGIRRDLERILGACSSVRNCTSSQVANKTSKGSTWWLQCSQSQTVPQLPPWKTTV